MVKNIKKIIVIIMIIILGLGTKVSAHNKNIKGYNDKNSKEIVQNGDKVYGYHNENEIKHYHQVEWDGQNKKWVIICPAVYYDEKFRIIDNYKEDTEKIEVTYYDKVDGDTAEFELDGEIIKVRFLGINTPETVNTTTGKEPYGEEASNYTTLSLENADKIEIEYDNSADRKDKYERILAWVWVNDSLLQKELVEKGLADTYMLENNYRYAGTLQLAKQEARTNKVGIWSNEKYISTEIVNNENNDMYDNIIAIIAFTSLIIIGIIAKCKKKR